MNWRPDEGTHKGGKFWLCAHPIWALGEAWLIGLVLTWLLAWLVGMIPHAALTNGILMLCAVCGMWAVLRARLPCSVWWRQGVWELGIALALSLIMTWGLGWLADWLGWDVAWTRSTLGAGGAGLVRALTGLGYLIARVGVRLWLFWDRLRRRRMLWSLTHAHLVTAWVVMVGVMVMLVTAVMVLGPPDPQLSPMGRFFSVLFYTVFPAVSVMAVLVLMGLAVVMPPSAVFSFFAARTTTRRLEKLAAAAGALRRGEYGARVEVSGEDELAQLQADFNAMADELERTLHDLQAERDKVTALLHSRRELVVNVSHDLRTPVATLRAMLESASSRLSDSPSSSWPRDLEVMTGEIQRLQALIDDLFTLSQSEVDHLTLNCQPTRIETLVQRMVDAMAPLAWQSGRVQVLADLPAGLPPVVADAARLEQILSNLLHNAVRHTLPGGIVVVSAGGEADEVRLDVRDTGEGIAEQDLPLIWERFYRGRHSRGSEEGSAGLGLAIVQELSEAMGGRVAVSSRVGEGSCFSVWLPRHPE